MRLLAALVAASAIGWLLYVVWAFVRTFQETLGDRYFKLPLAERRALKQRVAARARVARPLVRTLLRVWRPRALPSCVYRGVHGPGATCSARTFEATFRLRPESCDIFVATQMKCGTTWMQQIVYEILSRGHGDLGDAGHRHMYATSPWIESRHSVSLDDAPRVGPRQQRILKTHMPADLVPWAPAARYVYVARHPVACFASTLDFVRLIAGPVAPESSDLLDWFLSDRMFWRPWPDHVAGWWDQATERPNVLFLHYEEMLADLPRAIARVAAFLDVAHASATSTRRAGSASWRSAASASRDAPIRRDASTRSSGPSQTALDPRTGTRQSRDHAHRRNTMRMRKATLVILSLLGMAALAPLAGTARSAEDDAFTKALRTAMAASERPAEDKARDSDRGPVETLTFFGLRPNMRVLELVPGGGWYTRLLAPTLRDEGKLFVALGTKRVRENLLGKAPFDKVTVLAEDIEFQPSSQRGISDLPGAFSFKEKDMDAVVTFRNLHNMSPQARAHLNKAAFDALKPGGIYGVVDHTRRHNEPDGPENRRRMDPVRAIHEAVQAGFVFEDHTNVHYRADDELRFEVGRRAVAGNTDRFCLRFRKPQS